MQAVDYALSITGSRFIGEAHAAKICRTPRQQGYRLPVIPAIAGRGAAAHLVFRLAR